MYERGEKKMKKKLLLPIIALFAGIVLVACGESAAEESLDKLGEIKEAGELNIGTSPDYPPFEFYVIDANGERQIVGSDIDLAKAIAEEIGVELKITATDFNGVIANIQTGSVDFGIAGFTFTEERGEVMQFSDGYSQESAHGYQGLMMREDVAAEFTSLEDLKEADLVLGAQTGSIQFEMAQSLTEPANIKQYGTLDVGLAALNEGDIDGMVVSTSSAEPMLVTFPNLVILPEEEFNLDPDEKYNQIMIGFPQGKEYASLMEVANKVINESVENGDIEKWQTEAKAMSLEAVE